MEDRDEFAEARKAVNAKIGFFIHLAVYTLVNTGFVAINRSTSAEHRWFVWPLLGWGIGVFFHALAVFVFPKGRSLRVDDRQRNEEKDLAGTVTRTCKLSGMLAPSKP
jgi:tellurite resistance protein TehA-like permease